MNTSTRDFLTFRRMLTPLIIQIVFWVAVGVVIVWSLVRLAMSMYLMTQDEGFGPGLLAAIASLIQLVLLPLFLRIYAELIIIFFRMNETLTIIKNNTQPQSPAMTS